MATREAVRVKDKDEKKTTRQDSERGGGQSDNLRDSPMMAHLLDALKDGKDIGHFGRLTFAMVARHFLDEEEMVGLLSKQPDQDEASVKSLLRQVEGRDYNPPKRERILEWQAQQEFPICPTPDGPLKLQRLQRPALP